jgi:hypothetical protein
MSPGLATIALTRSPEHDNAPVSFPPQPMATVDGRRTLTIRATWTYC